MIIEFTLPPSDAEDGFFSLTRAGATKGAWSHCPPGALCPT